MAVISSTIIYACVRKRSAHTHCVARAVTWQRSLTGHRGPIDDVQPRDIYLSADKASCHEDIVRASHHKRRVFNTNLNMCYSATYSCSGRKQTYTHPPNATIAHTSLLLPILDQYSV